MCEGTAARAVPRPPPRWVSPVHGRHRQQWDATQRGTPPDNALAAFLAMSAEEREVVRLRTRREKTREVLGGGFTPDTGGGEPAVRHGTWQNRCTGRSTMTEWDVRKQRSREALRASPCLQRRSSRAPTYSLLRTAAEFGYDAQPYIELGPRITDAAASALQGEGGGAVQESAAQQSERGQQQQAQQQREESCAPPPFSLDLTLLSSAELAKVLAAVDVLDARFPSNEYLKPLHAAVLHAASSGTAAGSGRPETQVSE